MQLIIEFFTLVEKVVDIFDIFPFFLQDELVSEESSKADKKAVVNQSQSSWSLVKSVVDGDEDVNGSYVSKYPPNED